jgi:hypothetical protein
VNSDSTFCESFSIHFSIIAGQLNWLSVSFGSILFITQLAGCGSAEGPVRIPVTGKVTLDEAPLLTGVIRFVPADNDGGPAASTRIVGGEFEFSSDNGPVIANHRVEIEATEFQDFAIDDEAAFAAAAEATGESPVAINPIPAIYNSRSTLTASVTDADGQSFAFDLKTEQ